MAYRITGLSPEPFRPLFGLSDAELEQRGAQRWTATPGSGLPDRVAMRDAPDPLAAGRQGRVAFASASAADTAALE